MLEHHDLKKYYMGAPTLTNENTTLTPITIYIDHDNGTSPPYGTIVRSQAEYDNLGYDLKYGSDALDIIPDTPRHWVRIIFRTGNHYIKPTDLTYKNLLVLRKYAAYRSDSGLIDYVSWGNGFARQGAIYFEGERSVYDPAQSGVTAGNVLTRDSGTWVIDEIKDKFVRIISGAGAGTILPIKSNDATTLTVPFFFAPAGAVTFEIYENASILHDIELPATTGNGISVLSGFIYFNDLQFSTPTTGLLILNIGFDSSALVYIYRCNIYTAGGSGIPILSQGSGGSYLLIFYSIVETKSGYGIVSRNNGEISILFSYMRLTSGYPGAILCDTGTIQLLYNAIEPYGSFANYLVYIKVGYFYFGGNFDCKGQCKGILIGDCLAVGQNDTVVDNALIAIDIPAGKKFSNPGFVISGTGNTVGYKLDRGAVFATDQDPSGLSATTEIDLDGVAKTYAADVPNPGDYIVGVRGSQFHR